MRAGAFVPQSSGWEWLALEGAIALSALLTVAFSVVGFRTRLWPLKILGVITLLLAVAVGMLEMFWFL
jgi:hypothetical protein